MVYSLQKESKMLNEDQKIIIGLKLQETKGCVNALYIPSL